LFVEEGKPLSNGEFIRKCLQYTVQELCLERGSGFNTVSLPHATVTRRFKDMSDLLIQLRNKTKEYESFFLVLDVRVMTQVLLFIY